MVTSLKDCYYSIIAQTWKNWEVIIVDDGSADNSVSLILKLIARDPRFHLFENDVNRGCGYTKNRCASLAQGEIMGFLDPDDLLKSNALELMIKTHKKNKNVAIVTSKYEMIDRLGASVGEGHHGEQLPVSESYLTYGKGALTAFATFKKKFYKKTKGIDLKMKRAVDQDLYFKMEEQGKHLFLDKILYEYRIHDKGISQRENQYKAQYWHFYATIEAYKRRKKIRTIDNLSSNQIKIYKSSYYMERYKKAEVEKKLNVQLYFVVKALLAYPQFRDKSKTKSITFPRIK